MGYDPEIPTLTKPFPTGNRIHLTRLTDKTKTLCGIKINATPEFTLIKVVVEPCARCQRVRRALLKNYAHKRGNPMRSRKEWDGFIEAPPETPQIIDPIAVDSTPEPITTIDTPEPNNAARAISTYRKKHKIIYPVTQPAFKDAALAELDKVERIVSNGVHGANVERGKINTELQKCEEFRESAFRAVGGYNAASEEDRERIVAQYQKRRDAVNQDAVARYMVKHPVMQIYVLRIPGDCHYSLNLHTMIAKEHTRQWSPNTRPAHSALDALRKRIASLLDKETRARLPRQQPAPKSKTLAEFNARDVADKLGFSLDGDTYINRSWVHELRQKDIACAKATILSETSAELSALLKAKDHARMVKLDLKEDLSALKQRRGSKSRGKDHADTLSPAEYNAQYATLKTAVDNAIAEYDACVTRIFNFTEEVDLRIIKSSEGITAQYHLKYPYLR